MHTALVVVFLATTAIAVNASSLRRIDGASPRHRLLLLGDKDQDGNNNTFVNPVLPRNLKGSGGGIGISFGSDEGGEETRPWDVFKWFLLGLAIVFVITCWCRCLADPEPSAVAPDRQKSSGDATVPASATVKSLTIPTAGGTPNQRCSTPLTRIPSGAMTVDQNQQRSAVVPVPVREKSSCNATVPASATVKSLPIPTCGGTPNQGCSTPPIPATNALESQPIPSDTNSPVAARRLTGCHVYKEIHFKGKTGELTLSNKKFLFKYLDPSEAPRTWLWKSLKKYVVVSSPETPGDKRLIKFYNHKGKAVSFMVPEIDLIKLLKDIDSHMSTCNVTTEVPAVAMEAKVPSIFMP